MIIDLSIAKVVTVEYMSDIRKLHAHVTRRERQRQRQSERERDTHKHTHTHTHTHTHGRLLPLAMVRRV